MLNYDTECDCCGGSLICCALEVLSAVRSELSKIGVESDVPTRELVRNAQVRYGFIISNEDQRYELWKMGRLLGVEWWTEHKFERHFRNVFLTPLINFDLEMPDLDNTNKEEVNGAKKTPRHSPDSKLGTPQLNQSVGADGDSLPTNDSHIAIGNGDQCLFGAEGSQPPVPTNVLLNLLNMVAFSDAVGAAKAQEILGGDIGKNVPLWLLERRPKSNTEGATLAANSSSQSPEIVANSRIVSVVAKPWNEHTAIVNPANKDGKKPMSRTSISMSLPLAADLGFTQEQDEKMMKRYLAELQDICPPTKDTKDKTKGPKETQKARLAETKEA